MSRITEKKVKSMLDAHERWLEDCEKGQRADLSGLALEGFDFSQRTLDGIILKHARLDGATFNGASLKEADLQLCSLFEASFIGTEMDGANFDNANISFSNFCEARLPKASLRNVDLSASRLVRVSMPEADLRYSDLSSTYFSSVDLSGSDLTQVDFSDSVLRHCHLSDCILSDVNFSCTIVYSCQLLGSVMDGIRIDHLTVGLHPAPEGELIGWKKTKDGIIKILIPSDARRVAGTTRIFKAEKAVVLEGSGYITDETYVGQGEIIQISEECEHWKPNRWKDDLDGFFFFLTKEESENAII